MKNKEKYFDEILNVFINDIALVNDKIVKCKGYGIICDECSFHKDNCDEEVKYFLEREFKFPELNISTLKQNDVICVRNDDKESWLVRHFCKFEEGKLYYYMGGRTSHTAHKRHIIEAKSYKAFVERKGRK